MCVRERERMGVERNCVCERERERSLECVNEGAACMVERANPCVCVRETEAACVCVWAHKIKDVRTPFIRQPPIALFSSMTAITRSH